MHPGFRYEVSTALLVTSRDRPVVPEFKVDEGYLMMTDNWGEGSSATRLIAAAVIGLRL